MVAEFGWRITAHAFSPNATLPRTTIHRHDNAFLFTIYAPDTTASLTIGTPYGAPVFTTENVLYGTKGTSTIHPSRTWQKECRCFVRQAAPESIAGEVEIQHWPEYSPFGGRSYGPFTDAEVRFFPEAGTDLSHFEAVVAPWAGKDSRLLDLPLHPFEIEKTHHGLCLHLSHVTGYLHCMPLDR